MKVSEQGKSIVRQFEGLRLSAYRCPAGVWTIGYGHTKGVRSGMKITEQEAEEMLEADLNEFGDQLLKYVKVPLTQHQYDALVSFAYNIGVGAFAKSSALKMLNAGKPEAVPAKMALWNKARVNGKLTVLPGLVRRRAAEGALFMMDTPFKGMAQKVSMAAEKPLTKSRTMGGISTAAVATTGFGLLTEAKDQIEPYIYMSDTIKYAFFALIIAGLLYAAYARIDDWRNGER